MKSSSSTGTAGGHFEETTMTWPRYKLNYAFSEGTVFKDAKSSSEIMKHIDQVFAPCTADDGFKQVLKIFVTTQDKSLVQEVKKKLGDIANQIYGNSVLDPTREAFQEAIDVNIVYREDLDQWDYEQWTDKANIEAHEEVLF